MPLVIRLISELPPEYEPFIPLSRILSSGIGVTDLVSEFESSVLSKFIFESEVPKIYERFGISSILLSIGTAPVDSAAGVETDLVIRGGPDFPSSDFEAESRFIFTPGHTVLTSDAFPVFDSQIKFVMPHELFHPIEVNSIYLTIIFQTLYQVDIGSVTQSQTVFSIHNSSSTIDLVSVFDFESQHRIIFGYEITTAAIDSPFLFSNLPPPSTNTITDVYLSILNLLKNSDVLGPDSVDFVIDPDSIIMWPTNPPPFAILEPGRLTDTGNAVGGGRFGKVWEAEIIVHIVVENIFDESYKDNIIVTSPDSQTSPYDISNSVISAMEQAYPINLLGQPTTIEKPFFLGVDPIKRYKGSNVFAGIPLRFKVTFQEVLPAILP